MLENRASKQAILDLRYRITQTVWDTRDQWSRKSIAAHTAVEMRCV